MNRKPSLVISFLGGVSLLWALSACSASAAGTPRPAVAPGTATPSATNTPAPTVTPGSATQAATETSHPSILKIPLVTDIYTADPSAHVFGGMLYIYPSHDLDHDNTITQNGDQYDMEDYHVFSMANMNSFPLDHGQVLNVKDVPWAEKQMWAPDAAFKNGTYYLYFPAKDHAGLFRIGVATSSSPTGPFTAQAKPIPGSFSIDPAVFVDDDGQAYMYFGGLWGGQLEKWQTGTYNPAGVEPADGQPALGPRVAKLSADMLHFNGPIQALSITDENGQALLAEDHERRFFEASWLHKYNGTYYFSYSTGDTHYIAYATSQSPLGPFTFRGIILNPVLGWTTHHSIVEFQGKWYLFYHDSSLSGVDYKRCMKVAELVYNGDGTIQTIDP
ncbi:MAG TPA: glycoside hydrolase family 43 protein [Anaerolineales bacterium]|nr:glycoside hydrolase family 43 protein [Anaerolineales bacterium]